MVVTAEQLAEALGHALGRVHEFDTIEDKLAVYGLDPDAVAKVLGERWTRYRDEHEDSDDSAIVFIRAWVEGLLTGMQVRVFSP